MAQYVPTFANLASAFSDHRVQHSGAPTRRIAELASLLMCGAVRLNREFITHFQKKQDISSKNYESAYLGPGNVPQPLDVHETSTNTVVVSKSTASKCGELYPGRPIVRPRVTFINGSRGEGWNEQCNKDYRHHASHSPGLFTVQCVCTRPKLLGVTVMRHSESISTALTALLTRFPSLPRVVFYDNSCNFARSVRLRLPSFFETTDVLSDRFHYKGHRCCSLFDPDSYPHCDELMTSGAEALNARLSASRSHI